MNEKVKSQKSKAKTSENIIAWIKETVRSTGLEKVVIGLSGGIDSALSATLAVKALGKEHVYPVLLPYGKLHPQSVEDARLVIEFLDIVKEHVVQINIAESVDATAKTIQDSGCTIQEDIRRGNIMARVRMVYLFDLAKKLGALVCGTENKTEHFLGYFTRFGDEASDIEPIRSLYKTEVWEMANALGVPQEIIGKAPTAGLWEGQTDEGELGFHYKDADTVLSLHIDEGLSAKEIVAKGIREDIVQKVLDRVAKNEFKHKLPYVYK